MRGVKVFAGRSHPMLAEAICQRLGMAPDKCELGNFANGEISVQIGTSIRQSNVYIIQTGSLHTNDSVMELLIMINACKGGSARSITAVMPYFPYSRQSKKKSHRGSITAKMLTNLMHIAGVDHVITVDLHATQMQGFFPRGVDNLYSEPFIARWIKANVPHWQDAVVVSKNVGGSKRVTSLADALKLSFAIVSTDRARTYHTPQNMMDSTVFFDAVEPRSVRAHHAAMFADCSDEEPNQLADFESSDTSEEEVKKSPITPDRQNKDRVPRFPRPKSVKIVSSPLIQNTRVESMSPPQSPHRLERPEMAAAAARRPSEYEAAEGFHDEKAKDVVVGRLVHGRVVDDDHPSPALSGMSASLSNLHHLNSSDHTLDPMASSMLSIASSFHHPEHALGGSFDAGASSDEDEQPENEIVEHTITLVGNVKDKTVLLMDDLMDRSRSWIAAAETCKKRGGAKHVYCIGIHALFGGDSLEELEESPYIDYIVVTNTFPIAPERLRRCRKLIVIDLSNLLSEAIRRNHHGETISTLFLHD